MKRAQEQAAIAAQNATAGVLDLLNIVRFGDGKKGSREAAEAEVHLLKAAKCSMELAGFDPDEKERGELYRALSTYIAPLGED